MFSYLLHDKDTVIKTCSHIFWLHLHVEASEKSHALSKCLMAAPYTTCKLNVLCKTICTSGGKCMTWLAWKLHESLYFLGRNKVLFICVIISIKAILSSTYYLDIIDFSQYMLALFSTKCLWQTECSLTWRWSGLCKPEAINHSYSSMQNPGDPCQIGFV